MGKGRSWDKWSCIWRGDSINVRFGLDDFGDYDLLQKPLCERCSHIGVTMDKCDYHNFIHKDLKRIYAVSAYYTAQDPRNNLMSKHIIHLKNNRDFAIPIAKAMKLIIKKKYTELVEVDCIIPIPLHQNKRNKRGFDQAEEISSILANLLKKQFDNSIVKKIDIEMHSVNGLPNKIEAVKNLYECANDFSGKSILLIDDLATTGLDLSECAKVLTQCGASHVNALVGGRTAFHY